MVIAGDSAFAPGDCTSYRELMVAFQLAIRKAKARAWSELPETTDRDLLGCPYRTVMGKLRPWALPAT